MTTVAWSNNVNTKFYGYNNQPIENAIMSESISGRKVGYLANTKGLMKINCSINLSVRTELPAFWTWYNDTLGGLTGCFTCSALGNKTYRFVSTPDPQDTDLQTRALSLEIEEVI